MAVVTPAQLRDLLSRLPDPADCELCDAGLGGSNGRVLVQYGPFTVHVCEACAAKLRGRGGFDVPR